MALSSSVSQLSPLHHHFNFHLLRPNTATVVVSCLNETPRHHDHEDLTLLRKHNSKSTALIHHRLSRLPNPDDLRQRPPPPPPPENKAFELSLIRKRTPQYPGSISVDSSSPPWHLRDDGDEHRMIMRALEIRRKVTAEMFIEAMRTKGKFEAAAMKSSPKFSNSTSIVAPKL